MRENLPFTPEEARISYQTLQARAVAKEGPIDMVALAMRSSVAAEFEEIFEGINRSSVLLLPATMPLLALLPREEGGGQLLVHVCASAATLRWLKGSGFASGAHGTLPDLLLMRFSPRRRPRPLA